MSNANANFSISFPDVELAPEEIWPDGNAPENPTAEDVVAQMRKHCGGVGRLLPEWNLTPESVEVCGLHDHSKASFS